MLLKDDVTIPGKQLHKFTMFICLGLSTEKTFGFGQPNTVRCVRIEF